MKLMDWSIQFSDDINLPVPASPHPSIILHRNHPFTLIPHAGVSIHDKSLYRFRQPSHAHLLLRAGIVPIVIYVQNLAENGRFQPVSDPEYPIP